MASWLPLALLALAALAIGCGSPPPPDRRDQRGADRSATDPGPATGAAPTYRFSVGTYTGAITFSGNLVASDSVDVFLKPGLWGVLRYVRDEGSQVASGDLLATIDMSEFEQNVREFRRSRRHSRWATEKHDLATPFEIGKVAVEEEKQILTFELRRRELAWLEAGRAADQRWQAETEAGKAELEERLARRRLAITEAVVARGFDSPMSLRRQQIEAQSRAIEADYSQRRRERVASGPEPDERLKAQDQLGVASGEAWLAASQVQSTRTARQIERVGRQFEVEQVSSRLREMEERFAQRELRANRAGLVILPTLWNGQKVTPGSEVWEGLAFMQVVGTSGYLLDALVDEPVSALVAVGATATAVFDAEPGRELTGRVTFVGKSPRRRRRALPSDMKWFPVQIGIDIGSLPVRLGSKARIRVAHAVAHGVVIPRDLVRGDGASATVRLLEPGPPRDQPVSIETVDADFVRWLDPPADEGVLGYVR